MKTNNTINLVYYINEDITSLNEYINKTENISMWTKTLLTNKDWSHQTKYDYALKLISYLLDKNDINPNVLYMLRDDDPKKYVFKLDDLKISNEDRKSIEDIRNNITKYTYHDLDKIISKYGLSWTKINKSQFSGIKYNGNKGNQFELEFINNFINQYNNLIRNIEAYDYVLNIQLTGGANNKRPIQFVNNTVTLAQNGTNDIGKIISDVTLQTNIGNVYLSLKYDKQISLTNTGLIRIIPRSWYNSNDELSKCGKQFLNTLGIDEVKFKGVFAGKENTNKNTRVRKATYENIDVTSKVLKNNNFIDFIKSGIGYGYIMVHKYKNNKINITDIRKKEQLDDLVKDIKKVEVCYPIDAKRVEIHIEMSHAMIICVLRATDGRLEPNKFLMNYIINK